MFGQKTKLYVYFISLIIIDLNTINFIILNRYAKICIKFNIKNNK